MSFKTHVLVDIDSGDRKSGTTGEFDLFLSHNIDFKQGRQYFMRLENNRFPISYYNINSTNNVLKIEEDNGATQVIITATIPPGNYLISELLLEIETQLDANTAQANDYTINKSNITGKVDIQFTGGSTTITIQDVTTGGSTMNTIIGFEDAEYSTTDAVLLFSPNHVNLTTIRYLSVMTDISSHNSYTTEHRLPFGVKIPITQLRSNVEFFDNHNGPTVKLNNLHKLNKIRFTVKDNFGNIVDFNGVDWSTELHILEWRP